MRLLYPGLTHIKLTRLTVMVGESLRPHPLLRAFLFRGVGTKTVLGRFARAALFPTPGIGLIVDPSYGIHHGHMSILLKMGEWTLWRINGKKSEIGAAEPFELGVKVRKIAALEERIIAKVDARNNILGAESNLLGLGKEIGYAAIKHESPHRPNRNFFLWNKFRGVEHVKRKLLGKVFIEELEPQFPFRIVAHLNGV